jgi:hypothetical protein
MESNTNGGGRFNRDGRRTVGVVWRTAWSSAIVYVVLVGRFRGRAQALIGAFAFSLVVFVSAVVRSSVVHPHADLVQLLAVVCVMWICAICVSGARVDATPRPKTEGAVDDRDKVWDVVLKIFPDWMWVSRAGGTPVSLSQRL